MSTRNINFKQLSASRPIISRGKIQPYFHKLYLNLSIHLVRGDIIANPLLNPLPPIHHCKKVRG